MLLAAAFAQNPAPADIAEEVVVWAQPYARFDDKRWLVTSEVITPAQMQFGMETHRFRTGVWQIETVIHCNLDGTDKRLREAKCVIEDVALRAHIERPNQRDYTALKAQAEALVGSHIQLQVNQKGRVPNLDLDGLDESNYQMRQLSTGSRTLMKQITAAFHMDIPQGNPIGTPWMTNKEPLLNVASPVDGLSAAEVTHRIDVLDGHWVQQTVGKSASSTRLRNISAGIPCFAGDENPRCPKSPSGQPLTPEEPDLLDAEVTYKLILNAVAVIDPNAGYPSEKLWSVSGRANGVDVAYWSSGILRELAKDEKVTLGITAMVAAPDGKVNKRTQDLPPWRPINP